MEKTGKKYILILGIILIIVLAFSYIKTKRQINSSNHSSMNKPSIKLENVVVKEGSIPCDKNLTMTNDAEIEYSVNLLNNSDYCEFNVDVVNNSNYDVMLVNMYKTSFSKNQNKYFEYNITYQDNTPISENDLLLARQKETIKVIVKYRNGITPNDDVNSELNLSLSLDYIKANENGKEVKHKEFLPQIGDYVYMIPDTNIITIDTSKTGYTKEQKELNPKELTLWRVIKINSDNTIDIISQNASTVEVFFEGEKGYLNYIGYLVDITKKYENKKYTISSRPIGYRLQTKYLTNTSYFTTTVPWNYSTKNNDNEKIGGGDIDYISDLELIKSAIGSLSTTKPDGSVTTYFISSRYYYYRSTTNYYWNYRFIDRNGKEDFDNLYYVKNSKFQTRSDSASIRPILTLKENITGILGSGTQDDPYILD